MAALRAGAGLVTIASPRDALIVNATAELAVMVRPVDDAPELEMLLADRRYNAVAIGPGAGVGAATRVLVLAVLGGDRAAVIDADGLTSFAQEGVRDALFAALAANGRAVLTPHAGEFHRLFGGAGGRSPGPSAGRLGPRRVAQVGCRRRIQGPGHRDRRPRRPRCDQRQRAALARHRRHRGCPRRAHWRPARPGHAALRGGSCRGVDPRRGGGLAGPGMISEDLAPHFRDVLRRLYADAAASAARKVSTGG